MAHGAARGSARRFGHDDGSDAIAAVAAAASDHDGDSQVFLERMRALSVEHPADAHVRLYLGIALALDPERRSDAVTEMTAAIELEPGNPDHLILAASHVFDPGDLELAREYVARVSGLADWSSSRYAADLLEVAGNLAAAGGEHDRARKLLAGAVEAEPEDRRHARSYSRFLSERGEHDKARDVAAAGLAFHPEDERLRELRFRAGWFDACARVKRRD